MVIIIDHTPFKPSSILNIRVDQASVFKQWEIFVRPVANAASNLGGAVYNSNGSVQFALTSENIGTLSSPSTSLKKVRAYWTYGSGSYNRPYSQGCVFYIKYL